MIGSARRGRHAVATTTMVLGSSAVFGFVLLMNEYSTSPAKEEGPASAHFHVEKEEKPPPRRERPKPKPRRVERSMPDLAPIPHLASTISSVAIDLPSLDSSNLGQLSEQVLGDTRKNMVMDEGSVDEPPRPLSRVAPDEYPKKARSEAIEGYVTMSILIDERGDVERVKVLESKPSGVFDEVAVSTIRKWRFSPATYQAQQVRVWAKQTMRFELD